eukprot:15485870-Alexandrium_andersonii.AAC.2
MSHYRQLPVSAGIFWTEFLRRLRCAWHGPWKWMRALARLIALSCQSLASPLDPALADPGRPQLKAVHPSTFPPP